MQSMSCAYTPPCARERRASQQVADLRRQLANSSNSSKPSSDGLKLPSVFKACAADRGKKAAARRANAILRPPTSPQTRRAPAATTAAREARRTDAMVTGRSAARVDLRQPHLEVTELPAACRGAHGHPGGGGHIGPRRAEQRATT